MDAELAKPAPAGLLAMDFGLEEVPEEVPDDDLTVARTCKRGGDGSGADSQSPSIHGRSLRWKMAMAGRHIVGACRW